VLAGGLVASEAAGRLLHLDGTALLGLGALAGGWWLLRRGGRPAPPLLPDSCGGWIERCEGLLAQFERLEAGEAARSAAASRRHDLDRLADQRRRQVLQVALAGCQPPPLERLTEVATALRGPREVRLRWGHPLPVGPAERCWPAGLAEADVLIHHVALPLSAADLRWLEALPAGQPVWLLVQADPLPGREDLAGELTALWPAADPLRLLPWDGRAGSLAASLRPLAAWLAREGAGLAEATTRRCLEGLHQRWQADLEALRRREWQGLLQRTQWLVAAGVVVAPLPSLDLLVLAAANGLMLQEMARLWDCPWSLEQLRAAAAELARACLAQGVVEWSTQALAAAVKLHGATWLVGGALQALSAAYLTRVVGHAMADLMALSAGVAAPDLEAIKRQAPLLVARAAEAEPLDWGRFLSQGRRWLREAATPAPPALQGTS
jgi:hypothetical protein